MISPYKALLTCMLVAGCGKASDQQSKAEPNQARESDSGRVDASASPQTARGTSCPRTGLWALCSVEQRLGQAGFVVRRNPVTEPSVRPGFSVRPVRYMLGRSPLEVFIYPDEASLARDVASIDTVSVSPRGSLGKWGTDTPTFVRSANLAAVFLSDNPTQVERLTLALTAGAPQP